MHTLKNGYRAADLLVRLNWDRLLYPTAIFAALMSAAYIVSSLPV